MSKLVGIREQEVLCRERAAMDSNRRSLWTEKAEEWHQLVLLEIASHFRERQLISGAERLR